jgi:hypothetical protein
MRSKRERLNVEKESHQNESFYIAGSAFLPWRRYHLSRRGAGTTACTAAYCFAFACRGAKACQSTGYGCARRRRKKTQGYHGDVSRIVVRMVQEA